MERNQRDETYGDLHVWLYDGHRVAIREEGDTTDFLRQLVDGHVEHVNPVPAATEEVGFVFDIWVNDEFMDRDDWGVNSVASQLAGQLIIGPAVISVVDTEGATHGLTLDQVEALRAFGIFAEVSGERGCAPSTAQRILKSSTN